MKQEEVIQHLGASTSLRTGPGEVREVQFVVERNCRDTSSSPREADDPFPVWVSFPGYYDSKLGCTGLQFSLTAHGIRQALDQGMSGIPNRIWSVCEHMGHLIE